MATLEKCCSKIGLFFHRLCLVNFDFVIFFFFFVVDYHTKHLNKESYKILSKSVERFRRLSVRQLKKSDFEKNAVEVFFSI